VPQGDPERGWLEREFAELRGRESQYRERLSQKDAEAARLHAHAEALHQLLARRPPSRSELTSTLTDVARLSAQALRIERSSVWYFDTGMRTLRCALQLVGGTEAETDGLVIASDSCPSYIQALAGSSAVAVRDVYEDARTQELVAYLREHRIGALLDIPIVIAGELIGVVCHEHVGGPRVWEPDQLEFVAHVSQLVALALETERRIRAEYAERETEAKYRHLVESLPVTVYSFDVHTGQLDYVSLRALELGGRPATAWLAEGPRAWLARIDPEDRGPVMLRFQRGAQGGFPEEVTYRVHLDDGRTLWVRDTCRVVRDQVGQPLAIQGVLSDVTERTQTELARREIERRYRALLENVDVIALTLDTQGHVTFANEAFVRASGFSREELLGLDWFEVVLAPATRDSVRQRFLRDVAAGTVVPRFELAIVTRSGESRQLLSTNTLLRTADGTVEGTLSIALDVTERRNLESQLLQQTKLESLGRLAAGVAHDFNNLLTVMLGQVQLLERQPIEPDPGKRAAAIGTLEQAIGQATELTRSLLLYGRREPGRAELFSIDELVRDARPLLEALAGRELHLSLSLHGADACVLFDRARVRQALLNLVGNAADATLGHGTGVRVSTHVELLTESAARTRGAAVGGSFVVLSVADDGRGMEPRTLSRIFDPFFSTKPDGRGTGLGLAITQSVASQAGGFIDVTSAPGVGTTFRVYLPARDARSDHLGPPRRSDVPPAAGLRVLVVDDLKPIRDAVAESLRAAGYDTISVADTRAATEVLGSTPIDLLITDLHLPDGSGAVLARSARSARASLRVVIMSGSDRGEDAFDGVLSKPFDEATLLRVVGEALASP